jgi:hypothetical protein
LSVEERLFKAAVDIKKAVKVLDQKSERKEKEIQFI